MRACQIKKWSIAWTANRDRWDGRPPITQNSGVRSSAEAFSDDWEHWSRDSASKRWPGCPTKKNCCRDDSIRTKIAIGWAASLPKSVIKGGAGKQRGFADFRQSDKKYSDFRSSWAVSTASVASDRFSLRSEVKMDLSAQNLLSCVKHQRDCDGGHLDNAWRYFNKFGWEF